MKIIAKMNMLLVSTILRKFTPKSIKIIIIYNVKLASYERILVKFEFRIIK